MRSFTVAMSVWCAVAGTGLLVSADASAVVEAELNEIRGGDGVCQTTVDDPNGLTNCTLCNFENGLKWKGCNNPEPDKCVTSGTTHGYQPVCTTVDSSCGGIQTKRTGDLCSATAIPVETRPCPRQYATAIGTGQGGPGCP